MSGEVIRMAEVAATLRCLRGQKVLLDLDLAALYGVSTKASNQAVKRNEARFPEDFMFQLTAEEARSSRSQTVTLKREAQLKYRPYAFTEQCVGDHDYEIAAIIEAIQQSIAAPEKSKREIGFHVRETAPPYRTRRGR